MYITVQMWRDGFRGVVWRKLVNQQVAVSTSLRQTAGAAADDAAILLKLVRGRV